MTFTVASRPARPGARRLQDSCRDLAYTYIPTSAIVTALRKEGVQPFFACQSVVRDQTPHEYTRHMIRLRHEAQIGTKEAKEVVVVNAHDRYSAYNMMAGVLSPMA